MRGIVAALMSRVFMSLLLFAIGVVHLARGDHSIGQRRAKCRMIATTAN